MKIILCIFEKLSGLKINFHKSDFCFVLARPERRTIFIERYLGVNLFLSHLNILGYRFIIESLETRNGTLWRTI
jgi:hypothetical protein